MRIAAVVLFGSSSLAGWAYTLLVQPAPQSWVRAPLLATTIILTMACLIFLGAGRPAPKGRTR